MSVHQHYVELIARRPELLPHEEAYLRLHLHDCSECRRLAADYARHATLVRSLPSFDPPAVLRQRVFAAIHDRTPRRRSSFPFAWPRPGLLLAPVAAALLAFLAILGYARFPRPASHTALTHSASTPSYSGPVRRTPILKSSQRAAAAGNVSGPHPSHAPKYLAVPTSPPNPPTQAPQLGRVATSAVHLTVIAQQVPSPLPTGHTSSAPVAASIPRTTQAPPPPPVLPTSPAPTATEPAGIASVAAPTTPLATPTVSPAGAAVARPVARPPTPPANTPSPTLTPTYSPAQPPTIQPVTPTPVPTPTP
jgi:hypothetical protein